MEIEETDSQSSTQPTAGHDLQEQLPTQTDNNETDPDSPMDSDEADPDSPIQLTGPQEQLETPMDSDETDPDSPMDSDEADPDSPIQPTGPQEQLETSMDSDETDPDSPMDSDEADPDSPIQLTGPQEQLETPMDSDETDPDSPMDSDEADPDSPIQPTGPQEQLETSMDSDETDPDSPMDSDEADPDSPIQPTDLPEQLATPMDSDEADPDSPTQPTDLQEEVPTKIDSDETNSSHSPIQLAVTLVDIESVTPLSPRQPRSLDKYNISTKKLTPLKINWWDLRCCICKKGIKSKEASSLSCAHTFCYQCIITHITTSESLVFHCPHCKLRGCDLLVYGINGQKELGGNTLWPDYDRASEGRIQDMEWHFTVKTRLRVSETKNTRVILKTEFELDESGQVVAGTLNSKVQIL
ncbi:hypothetical protein EDC01DRAFT_754569 [Geopyxis carbonaria]|nr:hypothetical protein EDC01DRAFT_754569 [Geopyxis carbonaria]